MSAAGFPNWLLLEPFVFLRNDDESFPDETKAPIRASGTTSWGARFHIAFYLAKPPYISSIYAKLPASVRRKGTPLTIEATHRHLVLVRVATMVTGHIVQNFFIFKADDMNPSFWLKALPLCTEAGFDYTLNHDRPVPLPPTDIATPRTLNVRFLGLWCGSKEFVVAELSLYKPIKRSKIFADICFFRSNISSAEDGKWGSERVAIMSTDNPDQTADVDFWRMCCWATDTAIPFQQWLCWIDYNRGMLFCDMSKVPAAPTVSVLWFPLDKFPRSITPLTDGIMYRVVSVVNQGSVLKFVNVERDDGIVFGALKPGTGFTITCHTLVLGSSSMEWKEDYKVTSGELWDANLPDCLPRGILMFPQVDIERPHVVHFLHIEFGYVNKKMWVVSIDVSTETVESFYQYINGRDGLQDDIADLIKKKSESPMPFLPCEFTKFLNLSRERKCMESSLPTSS